MLKLAIWNIRTKLYQVFRKRFPFNYFLDHENNALKKLINRISHEINVAVDLGTGEGNALSCLPGEVSKCGIDICFPMLLNARKHVHAQYILGDIQSLGLKNHTAELVLAVGIFEYFDDIDPLISEIRRIIKPGGYAIISFSPVGFLTYLRLLLGHRIYPLKFNEMKKNLKEYNFTCIEHRPLILQHQVLVRKEPNRRLNHEYNTTTSTS